MKRSKAILLFVVLTSLPLAYVGWCWRTFVIGVPAPDLLELPDEYRPSAVQELHTAGLLGPERFQWRRAFELLRNPYETSPPPVEINTPEAHLVFVRRAFSSVVFAKYRDRWAKVPENAKIP
jgi:hypothetical protein